VIAVVDYGAGNLASVLKALSAVGEVSRVVRSAADLGAPAAIVVPGVGHFAATASLDDAWRRAVLAHVSAGRPLLGICLGMQWLFDGSDEAPGCPGLGLFQGTCRHLGGRGGARQAGSSDGPDASAMGSAGRLKVPHVGWNQLSTTRLSGVLSGIDDGAYAYFTHTYAAPLTADAVAATTHGKPFAAVVERGLVWGTQFHPEKSGEVGLRLLRNFVERA
jgi:imidazole glycerol-phosphate synthase subunit HisH